MIDCAFFLLDCNTFDVLVCHYLVALDAVLHPFQHSFFITLGTIVTRNSRRNSIASIIMIMPTVFHVEDVVFGGAVPDIVMLVLYHFTENNTTLPRFLVLDSRVEVFQIPDYCEFFGYEGFQFD